MSLDSNVVRNYCYHYCYSMVQFDSRVTGLNQEL